MGIRNTLFKPKYLQWIECDLLFSHPKFCAKRYKFFIVYNKKINTIHVNQSVIILLPLGFKLKDQKNIECFESTTN